MAMPGRGSRSLPRSRRLKSARDFARVRAEGRRLAVGSVILNWLPLAPGASSRLGVIAGRKAGGAVERSRMRRLLREAFRLHQGELQRPADLVFVARASMAGRGMRGVEDDVLAALRRARLLAETT
jgi:ribonuclease P protein component